MNISLRPYQHEIITSVRAEYRAGAKAVLLQSPTGSGKTVIFSYITESAAKKGNSVMILVHRQELLKQSSDSLFSIGVQHGLIAPGYTQTHDLIQVASVQTVVRRLDSIMPPSLIIIDEAHHAAAGSWRKILKAFPDAFLLGVTATPLRLDGKGLGKESGGFFEALINGPKVADLIEQGYLSKPVVYAPKTEVDLSGLHKRFGDYIVSETAERMDKPKIIGSAVEHYQKICPDVPAIVFCASVKHAEHVAELFNQADIPSESIDGTLRDWERKARINYLAKGRIKVLTSCEIVSEGTDIPVVTAAILLRPTASTGLYLQQCGRCLRPHPNKTYSVILDHVGNTFRHGFPDEDREWTLDGDKQGIRKANDAGINEFVQCENCYLIFHRTDAACPSCGWVRVKTAREIEEEEGELELLSREMAAEEEKRRIKIHLRREVGQAKTLEALTELGKKRGYKNPRWWAECIMSARNNKQIVYNR